MTIKARAPLILAALATLAIARPALADAVSLQDVSLLDQFNLIDLGNLTTSSESEGRVFVAGNEYGQMSNVGFNGGLTPSAGGYATLTVDGTVYGSVNVQTGAITIGGSFGGGNLNNSAGTTSQVGGNVGNLTLNGGALQYGGSVLGNVNTNGGATTQKVPNLAPGVAASTFAALGNLQGTLEALSGNSTVTIANNTTTFNAVPNASGQAIFHITAAAFASGQFQFNANGATSVIIDVDGATSINANANFLGGAAQSLGHNLIWNFNSATSITVGAEFGGTILAPGANVTNYASIDGTLVAANFNQYGELHSYDFTGSLPDAGSPASAVPEPSAVALLAAGLIGMTFLRRRKV
jgi:choice-of-anchor A domain-containing protein